MSTELHELRKLWTEVLVATGHKPRLDDDSLIHLDYDRLDYHIGISCEQCYDVWCIYCIDIERNADLIEQCEQDAMRSS